MARLLDRHREGAWPHIDQPEKSVTAGYADWAAVYDAPGNPILSAEEPVVRELLKSYPIGQALERNQAWRAIPPKKPLSAQGFETRSRRQDDGGERNFRTRESSRGRTRGRASGGR